jgi:hypothetical protein
MAVRKAKTEPSFFPVQIRYSDDNYDSGLHGETVIISTLEELLDIVGEFEIKAKNVSTEFRISIDLKFEDGEWHATYPDVETSDEYTGVDETITEAINNLVNYSSLDLNKHFGDN